MAIPEGYTKLGLVGYSDKGTYTAEATYNRYNVVLYNGSTYVALKDGLTGVEPSDDKVNWKYFARGFEAEDAAEIEVTDTYGVTDEEPTSAGGLTKKTILQTWLDKVADRIINKLVANDNFQTKLMQFLVNNGTTNLEGFGLDARFGKTLQDQISELNAKALIPRRTFTADADANQLTEPGLYRIVTSFPVANCLETNGFLCNIPGGDTLNGVAIQYTLSWNGQNLRVRTYWTSWSEWRSISAQ